MSTQSFGPRNFGITVLGRTLEHLGTQMYKRRDVAIAELVANAWDAGATHVSISIPQASEYSQHGSTVEVADNGIGMTADEVDNAYLIIGRNRRAAGQTAPNGRRVMGRKGVGKLAGFGLGRSMIVRTWRDGVAVQLELEGSHLKAENDENAHLEIPGVVEATQDPCSGTRITMKDLKHKTPPDVDGLHRALSRRFSRTVLGSMKIEINGEELRQPDISFDLREPETEPEMNVHELPGGDHIKWWAGFSGTILPSELQGITVLVNGKTAQAPPYFFGVESTASGQHGTKYLTGVIEADFLDSGTDDDSDRISTDRQEIDWDDEATASLKTWGEALVRRLLRERISHRQEKAVTAVEADGGLSRRLETLDPPSRAQAKKFIRALGGADADPGRLLPLSDTIIQAFEYRQFHDYIAELESAAEDPQKLHEAVGYIQGWKVLESRAILEIVKGRIEIIEKFFSMIVNDSTETAHHAGSDNMHDLLASYPWLISPEWQVLAEEKSISRQLREWGDADLPAEDRTRYDFLGLSGDGQTIVIEIKRSGHDVTLDDLQQLERYVGKLGQAKSNIFGVFITGDRYALIETMLQNWKDRKDILLLTWKDLHERTSQHYRHYKAVLDSELSSDSFSRKEKEVALTRAVLGGTSYRSPDERREGLGPQDVDFA